MIPSPSPTVGSVALDSVSPTTFPSSTPIIFTSNPTYSPRSSPTGIQKPTYTQGSPPPAPTGSYTGRYPTYPPVSPSGYYGRPSYPVLPPSNVYWRPTEPPIEKTNSLRISGIVVIVLVLITLIEFLLRQKSIRSRIGR